MSIFGDFLRPVFSANRVHQVSDLHFKFALRPRHVWKYDRHSMTLGEEKKKKEEEEELECGPMPNLMVALPNRWRPLFNAATFG